MRPGERQQDVLATHGGHRVSGIVVVFAGRGDGGGVGVESALRGEVELRWLRGWWPVVGGAPDIAGRLRIGHVAHDIVADRWLARLNDRLAREPEAEPIELLRCAGGPIGILGKAELTRRVLVIAAVLPRADDQVLMPLRARTAMV